MSKTKTTEKADFSIMLCFGYGAAIAAIVVFIVFPNADAVSLASIVTPGHVKMAGIVFWGIAACTLQKPWQLRKLVTFFWGSLIAVACSFFMKLPIHPAILGPIIGVAVFLWFVPIRYAVAVVDTTE